jgi:hypothetical protein
VADATALLSAAGPLLLDRWTRHGAVGAEHAAVAGFRTEQLAATLAVVEKLASVGRHGFGCPMAAMRTGQRALQNRLGFHGDFHGGPNKQLCANENSRHFTSARVFQNGLINLCFFSHSRGFNRRRLAGVFAVTREYAKALDAGYRFAIPGRRAKSGHP